MVVAPSREEFDEYFQLWGQRNQQYWMGCRWPVGILTNRASYTRMLPHQTNFTRYSPFPAAIFMFSIEGNAVALQEIRRAQVPLFGIVSEQNGQALTYAIPGTSSQLSFNLFMLDLLQLSVSHAQFFHLKQWIQQVLRWRGLSRDLDLARKMAAASQERKMRAQFSQQEQQQAYE
eukprot:TRINITY_DN503_c0_g1_i2.p1 TRINITY_DN503_c0_g1~~TRINITY_DN503_c0_g1_i2.p1  ORF type:complete len:175 (-),score=53.93 TRINITY_DN503_c0_g1_i2:128-652(-)